MLIFTHSFHVMLQMCIALVPAWLLTFYMKNVDDNSAYMFQKDPDGTNGVINVHGGMTLYLSLGEE